MAVSCDHTDPLEAGAPEDFSPGWEMLPDDDPGLDNDSPGAMIYTLMMRHPGYFGSADASLEFNSVAFWDRCLSVYEMELIHRRFGLEFHKNG